MDPQEIKEIIKKELPKILREDPEMREFVVDLSRDRFADRKDTERRFELILEELRRDREENTRKWEANEKKWEENQGIIRELVDSVKGLGRRHESSIGALGARWGLFSEESFRSALKGILEEHFHVQVSNVLDFDESGEVFGRPEQVELDVIVKDGVLIICEIKSSVSKADIYTFERKARFYEKKHARKATQLLIISPMVDQKARAVAEALGIKIYSYTESIDLGTFP